MNYKFHPILSGIPMMGEEELSLLAESIAEHGQKLDILLLDNMILDGRDRYLACLKAGVEPRVKKISTKDAKHVVEILTLRRKHWSTAVKSQVASLLSSPQVTTNGAEKLSNDSRPTVAEAAKAMGVSESSVYRARADGKAGKTTREIMREISPKNLTSELERSEKKIIKDLLDISTQLSCKKDIAWVNFPVKLFEVIDELKRQAEAVSGLEMRQ